MHRVTSDFEKSDFNLMEQDISLADGTMVRVYHKVLKIANESCVINYYGMANTATIVQAYACV